MDSFFHSSTPDSCRNISSSQSGVNAMMDVDIEFSKVMESFDINREFKRATRLNVDLEYQRIISLKVTPGKFCAPHSFQMDLNNHLDI